MCLIEVQCWFLPLRSALLCLVRGHFKLSVSGCGELINRIHVNFAVCIGVIGVSNGDLAEV